MQEGEVPPNGSFEDTAAIVRAAQQGDHQRFVELYERIAPALFAWASLRIRPAMRAYVDPQDVVQEVWTRAWKAFPGFDPETTGFRTWIFRIAKNVMLEAFRKIGRSAPPAHGPGPSTRLFQIQNLPDSATNVSRRLARHEGIEHVLAFVEKLEPEEQELFLHCGLEGMSYAEVSERLQIHHDTIAKRWQNLRERVGRYGVPKDFLPTD